MRGFGQVLARRLAEAELSQRSFATATRTPLSTVNAVIAGTRKPPKRRLGTWATHLRLTGQERDLFLVAGFLCHAPPDVRTVIERLLLDPTVSRRVAERGGVYETK